MLCFCLQFSCTILLLRHLEDERCKNCEVKASVVVKDLRLKDEDKDKGSSFKDKDKDLMSKDEYLKIGPRGSLRTRTFLEDNNTVNTGSQINARVF